MHTVYPDGPDCRESCSGADTLSHADYAEGFIAGEESLAAKVRATLPMVPARAIKKPSWFSGPTRTAWFKVGVHEAITTFGGFKR